MTGSEGFGLFGKVPSKGDFVTDGLPAEFVQPWDTWMQRTLLHAAERMGERWQTCFLSNPVWRFALGPGACGPLAWTGVIASSVDGVSRIYPLTLAASLGSATDPLSLLSGWSHGFEKLTDLALEMVKDKAAFERASAALRGVSTALPFPVGVARPRPNPFDLPMGVDPLEVGPLEFGASARVSRDGPDADQALAAVLSRAGESFSLMWLDGWGFVPFAIVGAGLPDPAQSLTLWEAGGIMT